MSFARLTSYANGPPTIGGSANGLCASQDPNPKDRDAIAPAGLTGSKPSPSWKGSQSSSRSALLG